MRIPATKDVGWEKVDTYTANTTYFSSGTVSLYVNKSEKKARVVTDGDGLVAKAISGTNTTITLCTLTTGYRPSDFTVGAAQCRNTDGIASLYKNTVSDELGILIPMAISNGTKTRGSIEWLY